MRKFVLFLNVAFLLIFSSQAEFIKKGKEDLALNQRLNLDKIELGIPADKLHAVPLLESCSIYLKLNPMPESNELWFRQKGQTEWQRAFELIPCLETKMLRGGVVNLLENTEYEAMAKC